jgi:hypothetical protein
MQTGRMFLLWLRTMKEEHCHHHSGDVAVSAWQKKTWVTTISTYHKDEMHVVINKGDQEETKPVGVCNYSVNMLWVDM